MKKLIKLAVLASFVMPALSAWAAPIGYSVNSDENNGDSLYSIDLATGQDTAVGLVQDMGTTLLDIEGMAFDNFGILWGVDDESRSLFPIDETSGQVITNERVQISGLDSNARNDYGLTFTCDGDLFASSVIDQAFYRLDLNGQATKIGSLGVNISALASIGSPARIYGLGNGLDGSGGTDNRSLYEIDPLTATATLIGPLGGQADTYYEGGLSFDNSGQLWAITDRSNGTNNLGSQVFLIDITTGQASLQSTTTATGFESLAVSGPGACTPPPVNPGGPDAHPRIPTLDATGRVIAIISLMLVGFGALRRYS